MKFWVHIGVKSVELIVIGSNLLNSIYWVKWLLGKLINDQWGYFKPLTWKFIYLTTIELAIYTYCIDEWHVHLCQLLLWEKINKCLIFTIVGKLPSVFQFDSYLKDSVCYIYLFASKTQVPSSVPIYLSYAFVLVSVFAAVISQYENCFMAWYWICFTINSFTDTICTSCKTLG